jgi:hypothetical protein
MDTLAEFFITKLEIVVLLDIHLAKLTPTWRNMRTGEAQVAKRLDLFLISDSFLEENLQLREWVSSGRDLNHGPIILELASI